MSGELAVCAGTTSPWNLHLINGLYDCQRSHAPVLGHPAAPSLISQQCLSPAAPRGALVQEHETLPGNVSAVLAGLRAGAGEDSGRRKVRCQFAATGATPHVLARVS